MRRVTVFNNITLDGYFADANGGIGWAHGAPNDPEYDAFVAENARGGGVLLLGRVTYELMASYWPTPLATQQNPVVAERMSALRKVVFSSTLKEASWKNTTLVNGDVAAAVRKLKNEPGADMAILGSGSIVSQLARAGLIDEYQFVLNPVVLGQGRTMFDGVEETLNLKLTRTRAFANGKVLLCYAPTA